MEQNVIVPSHYFIEWSRFLLHNWHAISIGYTTRWRSLRDIHNPYKRVKLCNHPHCLTCLKILSYNVIHPSITDQPFYLTVHLQSASLIYCTIYFKMHVGQTSKSLLWLPYRSAAKEKRKSTWPIYSHFSSRGHSFETQARILPLEHWPPNQLPSREIHWIS